MSAEEADKTTTTDASAGDEEEEWLYGGESGASCSLTGLFLTLRDLSACVINYIEGVEESTPKKRKVRKKDSANVLSACMLS